VNAVSAERTGGTAREGMMALRVITAMTAMLGKLFIEDE
jgi:hypothetical protein